jgi:hypothetical protein
VSKQTICFHRGCKRAVDGAPGPRYCREHAAQRVVELSEEIRSLQNAYGDALSEQIKALRDTPYQETSAIVPMSRKRAWAAQETKHFKREVLRLVRAYERSHNPVDMVRFVECNGVPDIDIKFSEREGTI